MKKSVLVITVGLSFMVMTIALPVLSYARNHFGPQNENQNERQDVNGTDTQDPKLACSISVPNPEPFDLTPLTKITAANAKAKALAGQPAGTTVLLVDLSNENGCLVYSVEMSNRLEAKVDAGNGAILQIEPIDSGSGEGRSSEREG